MTDTTDQPGISAAIIVVGERVLMVRRRVSEGELMWQFPAGGIEPGESAEEAAVRETLEETGLEVKAVRLLGRRVHPKTQRVMSYTACEAVAGEARVADADELTQIAWVTHRDLPDYVPYGIFDKVQEYLDATLTRSPNYTTVLSEPVE
jgi:8-oxo-dGTP diphosphatase